MIDVLLRGAVRMRTRPLIKLRNKTTLSRNRVLTTTSQVWRSPRQSRVASLSMVLLPGLERFEVFGKPALQKFLDSRLPSAPGGVD